MSKLILRAFIYGLLLDIAYHLVTLLPILSLFSGSFFRCIAVVCATFFFMNQQIITSTSQSAEMLPNGKPFRRSGHVLLKETKDSQGTLVRVYQTGDGSLITSHSKRVHTNNEAEVWCSTILGLCALLLLKLLV